jgi:hypothetical protein
MEGFANKATRQARIWERNMPNLRDHEENTHVGT